MSPDVRRLVAHAMSSRADSITALVQFAFHGFEDAGGFAVDRFADDVLIVYEEPVFGALRTVGVNVVKLREVGVEFYAVVGQLLLYALCE